MLLQRESNKLNEMDCSFNKIIKIDAIMSIFVIESQPHPVNMDQDLINTNGLFIWIKFGPLYPPLLVALWNCYMWLSHKVSES